MTIYHNTHIMKQVSLYLNKSHNNAHYYKETRQFNANIMINQLDTLVRFNKVTSYIQVVASI